MRLYLISWLINGVTWNKLYKVVYVYIAKYNVHCKVQCTLQSTMYDVHCTLQYTRTIYIVLCNIHVQCTLYVYIAKYNVYCTCILQSTMYVVHCTLQCTLYFAMYIVLCNVHVHNFIQFISRDSINQSGNKIKAHFPTSLPTATTTTPTTTKILIRLVGMHYLGCILCSIIMGT